MFDNTQQETLKIINCTVLGFLTFTPPQEDCIQVLLLGLEDGLSITLIGPIHTVLFSKSIIFIFFELSSEGHFDLKYVSKLCALNLKIWHNFSYISGRNVDESALEMLKSILSK